MCRCSHRGETQANVFVVAAAAGRKVSFNFDPGAEVGRDAGLVVGRCERAGQVGLMSV